MEQLLVPGVTEHVEEKKINRSSQHEFSQGKYCLTYPIAWNDCLVDEEKAMNVNLDFSKAFDAVSHKRLTGKLRKRGLSEWTVQWIEKWLNGRSQRAVFSHAESSWRPVTLGASQGSVLPDVDLILDFLFSKSVKNV